jgi:hypothetical protein
MNVVQCFLVIFCSLTLRNQIIKARNHSGFCYFIDSRVAKKRANLPVFIRAACKYLCMCLVGCAKMISEFFQLILQEHLLGHQ